MGQHPPQLQPVPTGGKTSIVRTYGNDPQRPAKVKGSRDPRFQMSGYNPSALSCNTLRFANPYFLKLKANL